jgi:ribosome-binding protein aMBF1 (putative translation factor)
LRTEKELAGTIRAAMKRKKLTKDHVAQTLKVNPIMLDKILCGDVVPSKHLEKQMIEHFGIGEQRVTKLQ